ncbi:hypothetical protein [Actinoplanes sp. G11-F43]|uniref:hypothetical protein n=1 Tax=Actinoplanes sp. G11-F43 TaxID=3424130 RepID=UPI003D33F762
MIQRILVDLSPFRAFFFSARFVVTSQRQRPSPVDLVDIAAEARLLLSSGWAVRRQSRAGVLHLASSWVILEDLPPERAFLSAAGPLAVNSPRECPPSSSVLADLGGFTTFFGGKSTKVSAERVARVRG